ncbi:MAG TPA: monofunctional biosynthetic peptidoglycan transglycosylase [Thermoanaerobaculia bacterium]|nr:monofunctional biosynthetic peptidoglycan transglycosylase [Thermoanaerobaculia bacterium]
MPNDSARGDASRRRAFPATRSTRGGEKRSSAADGGRLDGAVLKRLARGILIAVLALVAAAALFFATLPNVAALAGRDPATTAFIERRQAQLRREGRSDRIERIVVPLSRIAPVLRRAVVLTEDQNFYRHHGVDWEATRLAIRTDIDKRRLRVGGSTITQQLAKNLYLSPARTPWRKAREIAIALEMERLLPKSRILELYLNSIEWGERCYGAEAASRLYFGHPASQLTARESAILAAMIASPRLYRPGRNSRRLERRAMRILRLLER